jgi:hypothetical protein
VPPHAAAAARRACLSPIASPRVAKHTTHALWLHPTTHAVCLQARMLAKAHKSLIKVSCRAEILKHSQANPSKEVEQALSSHLLECNKVRHSSLFLNGNAVCNSSKAVPLSG